VSASALETVKRNLTAIPAEVLQAMKSLQQVSALEKLEKSFEQLNTAAVENIDELSSEKQSTTQNFDPFSIEDVLQRDEMYSPTNPGYDAVREHDDADWNIVKLPTVGPIYNEESGELIIAEPNNNSEIFLDTESPDSPIRPETPTPEPPLSPKPERCLYCQRNGHPVIRCPRMLAGKEPYVRDKKARNRTRNRSAKKHKEKTKLRRKAARERKRLENEKHGVKQQQKNRRKVLLPTPKYQQEYVSTGQHNQFETVVPNFHTFPTLPPSTYPQIVTFNDLPSTSTQFVYPVPNFSIPSDMVPLVIPTAYPGRDDSEQVWECSNTQNWAQYTTNPTTAVLYNNLQSLYKP
jgi:hypothetical protein